MGLTGAPRVGFVQEFVALREDQMAHLATFAQPGGVDWSGLLDGTRSLFDDEDGLVERRLGAEALDRYRTTGFSRRLTILTILATYADADWEEAVISP